MAKLLFDPITYQFYYRCRSGETARAIAAGFGWDPIRRRYCTDDPSVAMSLAKYGDTYVKRLLADVVEIVGVPANRRKGYCEWQISRSASTPCTDVRSVQTSGATHEARCDGIRRRGSQRLDLNRGTLGSMFIMRLGALVEAQSE